MRRTTTVLGWAIIVGVALSSGCVSLAALGGLAYAVDQKLSVGQPYLELVFTVERVVGTESYFDGTMTYSVLARDQKGAVSHVSVNFAPQAGDRFKWRFRRTKWLGLPMGPLESLQCKSNESC